MRTCGLTGDRVLSVYSEDKPFPIYKPDAWYSDKWDPLSYGRDFDFSRPFFPQFRELLNSVPQLACSVVNNQNCDYVNQCGWCKNCYLIFEADHDDACMYSNNIYDSRDTLDCLHVTACELCYECTNCMKCYNLRYSQLDLNCSDSWFLKNCIGCRSCFGCVNLRNKEYYMFNEPVVGGKEEYDRQIAALGLDKPENIAMMRDKFNSFSTQFPHKFYNGVQNEDSTGDYLYNTQRCYGCFNVHDAQDCKYVFNSRSVKRVHDMTVFGSKEGAEFCYENHEIGGGVRNVCFSDQIWTGPYNIYYSKLCVQSAHDLFGCVGLRKASYCIFNKQYSREEYEALAARIVEHMHKTGEWGEFFPMAISPYGYNETVAMEHVPLQREQAVMRGIPWYDDPMRNVQPQSYHGSRAVAAVNDSVLNDVFVCATCGKNFKLVHQELAFYRKTGVPLPDCCHNCRHRRRQELLNPRVLYDRACVKCHAALQTTYAPDRVEPVYCEACYNEAAA